MTEIMTNDTSHADPLKASLGNEARQNGQPTTPIAGIDEAALAGSARASKLIGSKVYMGDTSIGQIEDVLVDLENGTSTAFVLSMGGLLGIGKKLVAVPVSQIKVGSEASFMTDLTEAQLASAPAFDFGMVDQQFPDHTPVHPVSHA